MKLKSPTYDYLVISQMGHGAGQNGLAIDIAHLSGPSPADGHIKNVRTIITPGTYPQKQSYFHLANYNWLLEMVHARPVVKGFIEAGKKLWDTTFHHLHLSVWIDGKPGPGLPLDYMDRNIELYWLRKGQKHPVWTNWSTYADRQLQPFDSSIGYMVEIQLNADIKIENRKSVNINVRREPRLNAEIINKITPGESVLCNTVAQGDVVENLTNMWFKVKGGYATSVGTYQYPPVVSNGNPDLEKQLAEANIRINNLENDNSTLRSENSVMKPIYEAVEKIINIFRPTK